MAEQRCLASVVVVLVSICLSALAVEAEYLTLANASTSPSQESYDYIIVGGGTAGCPLAATLSEMYSVLLLERGGSPYGNRAIENFADFAEVLRTDDDGFSTPAQSFQSVDGVLNRRARVLGGGTAINAGFYSRAAPQFVMESGWNQALVNDSYDWVEQVLVSFPQLGPWQTAVRNGLLEAGVSPDNGETYEHIIGTKVGGTIFDSTGQRRTAANLLSNANPNNTQVFLWASVHQILFAFESSRPGGLFGEPRASGVIYSDERGQLHQAYLKDRDGAVILAAGALGSPQLLMLSGIGPRQHLAQFNIPVVLDHPLVGQGMADNPCNTMLVPSAIPVEPSLIQVVGITRVGTFIESASGSSFTFAGVGNMNALPPVYRTPELLANFTSIVQNFPDYVKLAIAQAGVLLGKVEKPLSRGVLRLNSTNILQNPLVQFNYFAEEEDIYTCIEGTRIMRRLVHSAAFANITSGTIPDLVLTLAGVIGPVPPETDDTALLSQWCRDTVVTIWHYHGGCNQGSVVDQDYKVLGVSNLRVVDGSTFNSSPGTNPQATVLMLGRYMGRQILMERQSR